MRFIFVDDEESFGGWEIFFLLGIFKFFGCFVGSNVGNDILMYKF